MAKERRVSSMDKLIQQAMGEGRAVGAPDDPAASSYPELWEWLSRIYIGRDRLKTPAVMTVQLAPEGVLVRLTDRDLCVSVEAGCKYLADALPALEVLLQGPTPPIKSWGKKEPQLRKRKSGN